MKKTVKRVLSMMLAVAMCMGLAVNARAVGTQPGSDANEQYSYELDALKSIRYVLYQQKGANPYTIIAGSSELKKLNTAIDSYTDYYAKHGTAMCDADLFALLKDAKYIPKSNNEIILQFQIKQYQDESLLVKLCSGDDYTVKENWPKELQKYRPMGEPALISDMDGSDWKTEAQAAAELLYRYGLFDGDVDNDGVINFKLNEIPTRVDAYIIWIKAFGEEETAKTFYADYVARYYAYAARNICEEDVTDEEWQNYIFFANQCRYAEERTYLYGTRGSIRGYSHIGRCYGASNRDFLNYCYGMLGHRGQASLEEEVWNFAADRGISAWLSNVDELRYGDLAIYILNSLPLKRSDGQPLVQNLVESGKLTQLEADALLSHSLTNAPVITATTSDFAEATSNEAADYLHELGLFGGIGTNEDGTTNYDLNRTPNRAEAITMLVRLLGKEAEAKAGTWDIPFTDVPEWAVPYVGYAYANGLTGGISATEFGSTNTATQAQYLTFILRAMGYKDGEDFVWDRAWELSDKLGLTDSTKQSDDFLRGDVAVISLKALVATPKSGKNLASSLMDAGVFTVENAVASNLIQSTATNIPNMNTNDIKKNEASVNNTQQENTAKNDVNVEYEDFTVTVFNREAIGWKVTTTELIIPETFIGTGEYGTVEGTHYRVTTIGNHAFACCGKLISVEIPNSVVAIGSGGFAGCISLTSINLPNDLLVIGEYAFKSSALTEIEIPSGVEGIDIGAFAECKSLKTVSIPNRVKSIEAEAFAQCTSLKTVSIPSSVEYIGDAAFSNQYDWIPSAIEEVYYGGSEEEWNQIEYTKKREYNQPRKMDVSGTKDSGLQNSDGTVKFHYNSTLPN